MKIINYSEIPENFFEYQEFAGVDIVSGIINDVKRNGDSALRHYSAKFGDGELEQLELSQEEIRDALVQTPEHIKNCIKQSVNNVKAFAEMQLSAITEVEADINGVKFGHKIIPLEITGAYVPGGNYPLPSSGIMSVVPAKVAGVKEVIVCSPGIKPVTTTACVLAGADRIFRVGGAQAIGAMAYGTESIPAVNKITGPGNKYVTAAKRVVYGVCGIDFLAGPSEVMVIADETANPEFIAADLLAQAEHDTDARAYLVTTSGDFARNVSKNVDKFLETLQTRNIAAKAIQESFIIIVNSIEQAVEISNKKAPEHLEICYNGAEADVNRYKNYGSLFIGNYSAEVFGDYCSGTNHTLPTNGVAKYSGGLSVFDFIKIQTYQHISEKAAAENLAPIASTLAGAEGLHAHKLSADLRIK